MGEEFLEQIRAAKSDATVAALIDTNVMMEVYSIGDLLVLGDKLGSAAAIAASPEFTYRQLRSRYSNLVAWWFARTGTGGGVLGNEVVDKLEGKLAPETDAASYAITTGIMHVVVPYVLKGLKIGALIEVDHHAVKDDADTELLRVARANEVPIVTWEGFKQGGLTDWKKKDIHNLRGRCHEAGVPVYTPQEFLASKSVDVGAEAKRFCEACRAGVDEAREKGVLMDTAAGRDVMNRLVGVYRWIMLDEVHENYAHLERAPWQQRK